jgi:hypothetical protein
VAADFLSRALPLPLPPCLQVYAQVDTAAGVEGFDSILEEADGVVLNRGNLGLGIAPEKVGAGRPRRRCCCSHCCCGCCSCCGCCGCCRLRGRC